MRELNLGGSDGKNELGIWRAAIFILLCAAAFFALSYRVQAAVVVLDPGHGGAGTSGSGAIYDPYVEKALTMDVANKLKDELSAAGVTVYMTRSSDVAVSLPQRAAYAKSVGADLLVSLHFNASGPHDKTGTEVWASAYGDFASIGRGVGNQILAQISALGLPSKGVKSKLGDRGDYYAMVRNSVIQGIPGIIVEHCFIDHPYDRAILASVGTAGLAHADAAGILNYISSVGGVIPKPAPVTLPTAATASGPTTAHGCPVDAQGNVAYTDGDGETVIFSSGDWNYLLSLWSYTGDPEAMLHTQSVATLRTLLSQR